MARTRADSHLSPPSPRGAAGIHIPAARVFSSGTMSVVLIGMMGVGKTTLGRAASKALGWRFIDVDRQIEEDAGRSISDIFSQDGEPAFRKLETDALVELSGVKHAVVATGGGAPIEPG